MATNLPKGANASFIDRTADRGDKRNDQREVLIDKGGTFKISDIRKMKDSDSYELDMDLLAEEEGVMKDSALQKNGGSLQHLNDGGVRQATKADLDAIYNLDNDVGPELDSDLVVELPGSKKKSKKK